jgi:uncharacterized protein (TIGR02391 family)
MSRARSRPMDQLAASLSTRVFSSPEEVYKAATRAVSTVNSPHRTLDIAALHGHAERREIAQSPFSLTLMEAMLARVREGWRLRRAVSITSDARLDRELQLIQRLDEFPDRCRAEVRIFVTDSVPVLAPLIIERSIVFLGAEDPRDFGASEGLMITGEAGVAFCERYFESLWTDDRAVRIRTQAGLRQEGLERVRNEMMILDHRALSPIKSLHPEVLSRCRILFESGNYAEAVEKSFKVVRDRLRALTGHENGSEAFGRGRLRVAGAAANHVDEDFNQATKFLTMAIDRFRNEKAHTSDGNISDPIRAAEYLAMSSLAMRLLDNPRLP